MVFDLTRPPLPAPTEPSTLSSADHYDYDDDTPLPDDVATNLSARTDRTSYSIPEDGTPVTINTTKLPRGLHKKYPSQASLLIEYFEASKQDGPSRSRPSVRVRVTPSLRKKQQPAADPVQIRTSRNSRNARKPAYTQRVSLADRAPNNGSALTTNPSDDSAVSSLPPFNIEVLSSDSESEQGGRYLPMPSDISSMPADSMLEGPPHIRTPGRRRSRSPERHEIPSESVISEVVQDTLKAPKHQRSRSMSKDRITQRVMEKLQAQQAAADRSSSKTRDAKGAAKDSHHRRRSRDVREDEVSALSATDSSLLSSSADRRSGVAQSVRSGASGTSSLNNPKLLATVEDAIRRLILPELNALKEENRTSKNRDKFERLSRDSNATFDTYDTASSPHSKRRVSKSSSTPNISGAKPKINLNRDGEESPVVLSGSSSRKERKSSRGSISERSTTDSTTREKSHRKKSKEKVESSARDKALAGLAGAGLTAAALKHHTSREEKEEEAKHRKHRSSRSSHSRSASVAESTEEHYQKPVPPMPFTKSELHNGSELTRDSILSADTETRERPSTSSSRETNNNTPLQQVPRGYASSPTPHTPTRTTPTTHHRSLGPTQNNHSLEDVRFKSPPSSERSYGSRSRDVTSAMAAAAAKARAIERSETQASHYEIIGETPPMSPVQSEASYREAPQKGSPHNLRAVQSAASVSSLGRHVERQSSNLSIRTLESTASTKAARTRKRPQGGSLESTKSAMGSPQTPQTSQDAELFFELNHEQNEAYRRELEEASQVSPVDQRITIYTDDSEDIKYLDSNPAQLALGQTIRKVGSNPEYVHTPMGVESAVASLHDPSVMSVRSSAVSSPYVASPLKKSRLSQVSPAPSDDILHLREDEIPTGQRWADVRDKAEALTAKDHSPPQSIAQSVDETPEMHHSAFPTQGHMMPELGYGMDDGSEISTNPSIIQGPLGGDGYYDHAGEYMDQQDGERTPTYASTKNSFDYGALGAGAGAAALGAAVGQHFQNRSTSTLDEQQQQQQQQQHHQATVEDDYDQSYTGEPRYEQGYAHSNRTPLSGATGWKDEGYQSANQREGYTPQNRNYPQTYENDEYGDEYDDTDMGADDVLASNAKHTRNFSGNSHGMASPLYDSATGKGIDHIQSKDIVALMDHLTVRDAQRNARDTEILVTLVRSAAEMRNQLDEMKQFIKTQDNMIMHNTEKRVDVAEQRILGGPRPQPMASVRTARPSLEAELDAKKKNVFKRALKGLSMKGDGDIKNIESMLVQLLGDVEGLKQIQQLTLDQQGGGGRSNSLTSYENLRASGDPSGYDPSGYDASGYEPEGRANTNSSPDQSGYLSNPSSSRRINDLHSGYDVVQTNRISTVHEDDEEYLEREPRYEDPERMATPTQEAYHGRSLSQQKTPPEETPRQSQEETTPKRKHKSTSSSIFGIPKISRWSKTTSSTNPESLPRNSGSGEKRPYSTHSRSSSRDDYYDDEPYAVRDDRSRSNSALSRRDGESIRSASPLIPDDELEYELDDPKYKAHRNSLNLQHPQPRAGPTGRHQNHLETQAQVFEPVTSPDYDQWGSMPSLARNRLSTGTGGYGATGHMSPISSDGGYSQHSASEQLQATTARPQKVQDDGPLIPTQQTLAGYGQTRQMYSSPNEFGSQGVLTPLPPIAEVRYSLETDSGRYRVC
jgi:hypothetical protein